MHCEYIIKHIEIQSFYQHKVQLIDCWGALLMLLVKVYPWLGP